MSDPRLERSAASGSAPGEVEADGGSAPVASWAPADRREAKPQVEAAITHLRRGLETGAIDEFRAAQSIIRKLESETSSRPEERERRRRRATAQRVVRDLAPSAAAYDRYLKRTRKSA